MPAECIALMIPHIIIPSVLIWNPHRPNLV